MMQIKRVSEVLPCAAPTNRVSRSGVGIADVLCLAFCIIWTPGLAAEPVVFAPELLDMGTFMIGASMPLQGAIAVTNRSDETLTMGKLRVSCGCIRVLSSFASIEAGETKEIVVQVRPESGMERETTKIMTVQLEGAEAHQRAIRIRWNTAHPVAVSPEKLVFDKMTPGESRTAMVNLQIADPMPGERLSVKRLHATYPFIKTEIISGTSIRVDVTLPTTFESARSSELVVDVESSLRSLPTIRLPVVVARIPHEIMAAPSRVTLFQRPPQEGKTVRVKVFDREMRPLEVTSVGIRDAGASEVSAIEYAIDPEQDKWRAGIDVVILPQRPGSRQMLVIQFEKSAYDEIEIPVYHSYE